MIRAKLSAKSHSRDNALDYLRAKMEASDWNEWKRAGDITLAEHTDRSNGARYWLATVTVVKEDLW